jgi:hypothetical protein
VIKEKAHILALKILAESIPFSLLELMVKPIKRL